MNLVNIGNLAINYSHNTILPNFSKLSIGANNKTNARPKCLGTHHLYNTYTA